MADQLIALWTVFLLGTLFHTQLALIPLFHGLSVLAPHGHVATDISEISSVLWLMLAFFILPLMAMVGICFFDSRQYRLAHLWLTLVYSVLNVAHLVVDMSILPVAWYQVTLMAWLVAVGLGLNRVAYHWFRESHRQSHSQGLQSTH
ncbi:hypothetical protein C7293_20845 [filamentous cyanobacterium CCT1]|nr:hypothetical protein C7293_20845 [filamentous cyanobacterium CCT1]PSN75837.1 hypothetical protein C8B47_30485 [filamentous cyanobacterium CCP4]